MNRLKKLLALGLTVACLSAAIPTALAAGSRFTDVPAGADYAAAVDYVVQRGLMNGTSATTFGPDAVLTRGAMATILYRASGSPTVYGTSNFTDTQAGQWYSSAVTWASATGVMQGYGGGRFGPNEPVSQEQLRVLLGRYTGNPVDWTGDPALAADATRAQVAVALEEANIRRSGTLRIAQQGIFSAGGITKTSEGTFDPENQWEETGAGQTAHVDHANVLYQIPENADGLPMVFLHGYGQSRMGWMTTPDGREGWSDLFMRMGHSVFLIDEPRRGEAGATSVSGEISTKTLDQRWYTQFRIGRWENGTSVANEGSQFPNDDASVDQFFRQMTPDTGMRSDMGGDFDNETVARAVAATIDQVYQRTGKNSILVTHSQGGGPGWTAARYTDHIAAIVAIEPGGAPGAESEDFQAVSAKKIPVVMYFGDYIDNGDPAIQATGMWQMMRQACYSFAEAYNAQGGNCTVVDLPKVGITGNDHFMFQDLNNDVIAELVEDWIQENVT